MEDNEVNRGKKANTDEHQSQNSSQGCKEKSYFKTLFPGVIET